MSDATDFTAAARRAGLHIEAVDQTGALRRVPVEGDRHGQQSGWYLFHADTASWAMFGNWKTGEKLHWRSGREGDMTLAERNALGERIRRYQQEQRQRTTGRYMHARGEALRQFKQSQPADPVHPYLARKGVGAYGIRQIGACLLIPLCDSEQHIWSLQRIDPEGNKRFLADGRKHGMFHLIGPPPEAVLCIAEGYATAASIHEATGYPVAVAFDAGNLEPVAVNLRRTYPHTQLVICADDDTETAARIGRNPGVDAATKAARAARGCVAMPPRETGRPSPAQLHGHVQCQRGA